MELIFETDDLSAYLQASEVVDFNKPALQKKIAEIQKLSDSDEVQAKAAFEYVRDKIAHSFDLKSDLVTISASETLACEEGICFAKAHLLAALLRGLGIPTGFCYQRVTRKGTPESGYALHGLNAIYVPSRKIWFRLDPRGNKPGINSQFSIETEQLAYTIHPEFGEIDYPYVFINPQESVLAAMRDAVDYEELFYTRPESIESKSALQKRNSISD